MRRKRRPPVADPLRDAEARFGIPFRPLRTVNLWQDEITRCTTGQFARLDGGYHRHCGPTAITNLILTMNHRYGWFDEPDPAEVFSAVSRIGKKRGIYWNTDILGYFGGTYDVLTDMYIRASLRQFGIPVGKMPQPDGQGETFPENGRGAEAETAGGHIVSVRWRAFPSETQFVRELDAGKLLYLQLHLHPCYGNHHLLCYGYTILISDDSRKREIYLLLADGWSRRTRYLRLKSRGICHFFAI